MKGIILAGGKGSRLYPCTAVTNKHLLVVYDKPMVYYPLNTLIQAGLKDIIIVTCNEHLESFKKLLTLNGKFNNINFEFVGQKQAGGIAHALAQCKQIINNDKIVVILGDNIFEDDITDAVSQFAQKDQSAKIFLKKVDQPEKFSVVNIQDEKIMGIEEKPVAPKSDLAMTGLYMYDKEVWQVIEGLNPSIRGELEITEVNNYFLKKNKLDYLILNKDWFDIDTYPTLLQANISMAQKNNIDLDSLIK